MMNIMEPSESTNLIFKGISRIRTFNRKAYVYSCIVVFTIVICSLLLIIGAKRNSNIREDYTDQRIKDSNLEKMETNHPKIQYLVDMLPASFTMTLRVLQKQAENWILQDNQDIIVEFNRYGRKLRYRECYIIDSNKSDGETYNLGDCVLVAEGQSMYHISGESDWKCFHHVETLSVYYIIQLGLNATQTYSKFSEPCHGRKWKVEMQNGDIFFCENAGQLLTVHQNNMKAEVIHWTSPATEQIKVPYSSKQCIFKSIDISYLLGKKKVPPIFKTTSGQTRNQVKDCLFVHGSGRVPEKEPSTGYEILSEYKSYWGDISYYTPQCKSRKFIRMNTIVHGWDNSTLHEQFCEFAAGNKKVVSEKIIFSHSMGNLIIAAALHRNLCSFDTNSTEWYSIGGPWKGSKVVDQLKYFCPHLNKMLVILGFDTYCTDDGKIPNTAYTSMRTDYKSPTGITYTDIINVSKRLVKGVMCGDSSIGIGKNWKISAWLAFVQTVSGGGKISDGLVALDGCSAVGGTFQETFESQFYRGGFNHLEGTCMYGDASWTIFGDFSKLQPCKWISLR
ncbi:hypothetical protein CHS0354_005886 [Potamilus streckersoni]|uniref:Uncharacterized protein n=1 Tax=Potamilus streckersoni TaxID=2493646 RepID=A0AAE0W9U8_9BIVA|nr:hypothetical protein CHS0354_005886 [Potamilus streckersoni]